MATTTKKSSTSAKGSGSAKDSGAKKKNDSKAYAKSSRCWPGFEPVPGKGEHEEGSCRKKPASRNGGKDVNRETARHKQMAEGGKRAEQAKSKSPNAAERKTVSKAAKEHRSSKSAGAKSGGAKSTGAKSGGAKRSPAAKKSSGAKKTSSKKAASK